MINLTSIKCDQIKDNLTCFTSLSQLTQESVDFFDHFIMPIINLFSITTNLASLIVFSCKSLRKDGVGQLMFIMSISDFIYSLACIPLFVTRCGAFCSFSYSYWTIALELYYYFTITYTCLLFNLLVDIYLAIIKLSSFSTKKIKFSLNNRNDKIILIAFLIVSIMLNAPIYIISNQVEQIGWLLVEDEKSSYFRPLYTSRSTQLTSNSFIQWFLFSLTIIKGGFLILILLIINIVILSKYRDYVTNKLKIFNSSIELSQAGKFNFNL